MKYSLCSVPGCSGYVTDQGKTLGLCNKHLDWARFLQWAMNNIKVQQKPTEENSKSPSGLYLPK